MLRFIIINSQLGRASVLRQPRAYFHIRDFWPEPITQQTIKQFLEDINYFQKPRQFTNIGLETNSLAQENHTQKDITSTKATGLKPLDTEPGVIDDILDQLSREAQIPQLDYHDVRLEGEQLKQLAIQQAIFRDLFGKYEPDRDFISFTKQQAENLDKLIPHYWITDQPHARVRHNLKQPDPLKIFHPFIGISAKFIHSSITQDGDNADTEYSHTSYYGNVIPACDASMKPSITIYGNVPDENGDLVKEIDFDNWSSGELKAFNFATQNDKCFSLVLVNLDYLHPDSAHLHWMISNMKPNSNGRVDYEEVCDYLPVHGIRGFGHSRYVFVLFQHDKTLDVPGNKINGFSLDSRRFDCNAFLEKHKAIGMVPVGLSWFQTSWDSSSNSIFHDYLKLKAPIFEHVQAQEEPREEKMYPGLIPFHLYLDHFTSKKSLNQRVLLERLNSVDPFNYQDQYVPPRVPVTALRYDKGPSWTRNIQLKKKLKVGYWRGLRPASATLPLDNNADLDYPPRPIASSLKSPPEKPNNYSVGRKAPAYKFKFEKSLDETSNIFIQDDNQHYLGQVKKIIGEFKTNKK